MNEVLKHKIDIFTDGSCYWKDGIGGWAYLFLDSNENVMIHGSDSAIETTSQQMEMVAVICALTALDEVLQKNKEIKSVTLHSDSAYIVNCINERWYLSWRDMGWVNIKNVDLWKGILNLIAATKINFQVKVIFNKIPGHSGIGGNEFVDDLSGKRRKERFKQQNYDIGIAKK